MKNCYVSTFISGLSDLIKNLLEKELSDVEIVELFDGMVIYKTVYIDKVNKLKFVNNSFLLIGHMNIYGNNNFNDDMNDLLKKIKLNYSLIREHLKNYKKYSFKILTIDKNQPVSINYKLINRLENDISNNLNLKLNKRNPDLEFLIIRRSEGIILFMLKLTYNRITEKTLHRGELRPELAYCLASLTDLDESKIVMDPFCGYGSIPKQIIKNFKYNMCFASDNNDSLVQELRHEYKNNTKKLFIKTRDALNLDYFEDGFIDVIITDPPWNIYGEQNEDFYLFYEKMLNEFNRILKDNGCLIILMGNINDFELALNNTNTFSIKKVFNMLVNGKKANIYVLLKQL